MNIKLKKETIQVQYVYIDDYKIELDRLAKLLDKLKDCNGHIKTLSVNDDELEEKLHDLQIIKITHRGGWYPGKQFKPFKQKIDLWNKK